MRIGIVYGGRAVEVACVHYEAKTDGEELKGQRERVYIL